MGLLSWLITKEWVRAEIINQPVRVSKNSHGYASIPSRLPSDVFTHKTIDNDFDSYPIRHREVLCRYYAQMFKLGQRDTVKALTASFKWVCFAHHCLTEADRLGNPRLPFPVTLCYGDLDWLGTNGPDKIVLGNKLFADCTSQIFIFDGADHTTFIDDPDQLA